MDVFEQTYSGTGYYKSRMTMPQILYLGGYLLLKFNINMFAINSGYAPSQVIINKDETMITIISSDVPSKDY